VLKALAKNLPEINPAVVLGTGATQIKQVFTAEQVPIIEGAYMTGLKAVFAITVAAYGTATLVGVFGSWKKLHAGQLKEAAGGAA